jgi:hypothetical protein
MAEKPEEKPAATVDVTLLRAHEHGGKAYKKGDKINVTEAQAARLQAKGVIGAITTGSK